MPVARRTTRRGPTPSPGPSPGPTPSDPAVTRSNLVLAAVVVAAGLAWLVERLVVTDREAVTDVVTRTADAVTRGAWDDVAGHLDETFAVGRLDKAAFVAWARAQWNAAPVRSLSTSVDDVRVEGDRAAARVVATVSAFGVRVPARVDLERRGSAWRIVGIEPEQTGTLPVRWPGGGARDPGTDR